MNKAQSEIMGLMVVVMLILALFVIFVRFSLLKPTSLTDELRTNVETTNLLRAMMKTTIDGEPVQDMVIQCYNTAGTCTDLEQELQAIFQATLKPGETYYFLILANNEELLNQGNCDRGIVSTHPFTQNNVFYEAKLRLC